MPARRSCRGPGDSMVSSPKMPRNSVCRSRAMPCRHLRSACVMAWLAMWALSLCTGRLNLPVPGLGAHLDCFPRAAQRRGVGQVEVTDVPDRHAVEDRSGGDVDPLGDLGVLVTEQLHAEQPPGTAIPGHAHRDAVASGVVALVVIRLGLHRDRVEPGCRGLVVAETRSGSGLVEDLHDLGAEAAGELPARAERVLARDPALLVRGGTKRQIRLP